MSDVVCNQISAFSSTCALCSVHGMFFLHHLFEDRDGDGDVNGCNDGLNIHLFLHLQFELFIRKLEISEEKGTYKTSKPMGTSVSSFLCFFSSFAIYLYCRTRGHHHSFQRF